MVATDQSQDPRRHGVGDQSQDPRRHDTDVDAEPYAGPVIPLSARIPARPSEDWKLKVFLMNLAKNIDDEELNVMKDIMKGEDGMGKRALSQIKTVRQFFQQMMDTDLLDKYNLLHIQSLLWHLGRKDLHKQLVSFARDYRTGPLHFFVPEQTPKNGYKFADFHIGGDLEKISMQDLSELRTVVSELLCVPAKFVFIKGIVPRHSIVVTFMVPVNAVYALFELSDPDKSILQTKRVDSYAVGDDYITLRGLEFEKPVILREQDEIKHILEKREHIATELDKSQAKLIERSKALSSSEEELAKVKVTSDELKLANDRAMMLLATLVYQDLAHNGSPVDSLSRLSVLNYFKCCVKNFQSQFPEAAQHVGDLLDANSLVVRKTERDLHKNYVERLQIHQLALEHRCQTIQPARTLPDILFQQPSQAVRQQYAHIRRQQVVTRPISLITDSDDSTTPVRKTLFDRRVDKTTPTAVSLKHPYSDVLREISLKLKDRHKDKLLGNTRFNKCQAMEVDKHPARFLHVLLQAESGGIPDDPYNHILAKLRKTDDKDLQSSASELFSKRKIDLEYDEGRPGAAGSKKTSHPFSTSMYRPGYQGDQAHVHVSYPTDDQSSDGTKPQGKYEDKSSSSHFSKSFRPSRSSVLTPSEVCSPPGTKQEVRTKSEVRVKPDVGVKPEVDIIDSDLERPYHVDDATQEKLDRLLSQVDELVLMLKSQMYGTYQSPIGTAAGGFRLFPGMSPTDARLSPFYD